MVIKRTFAQKQAAARAVVKAREVSRLERGITTSREREIARRTGVSALERARSELQQAKVIVDPRREAPRYATMAFPRVPTAREEEARLRAGAVPVVFRKEPREYYREAFIPKLRVPPPPPIEPLRET